MAIFKDPSFLRQTSSTDFEHSYRPGQLIGMPGIYKCSECGRERVFDGGVIAPDHNHNSSGRIYFWELIVRPDDITY